MISFKKMAALSALLLGLPLLAFQRPSGTQEFEQRVAEEMERYRAVGLAVAVVRDNQLIYNGSFGWKDLEAKIPLEKDDLFRIASISKSFSALAILQLMEAGKLSLDDTVTELLGFAVVNPKYPDIPITLEMLLTHTSSLTDSQRYSSLDIINPKTNPNWAKSYADRRPGEKYEYCNLGYNTIGAIIEKVSGQRFDAYITEHILAPLGLEAGYLVDALDADRFAQLYRYDAQKGSYTKSTAAYRPLGKALEGYRLGYDAPLFSPTGGLKISAPDLARYMRVHMNQGSLGEVQIVSRESAALMQAPRARMDAKRHYGFALRVDTGHQIPGVPLIGHTGSAHGLNSAMFFDPVKKYGLVVITNGFVPSDPLLRERILALAHDHFIERVPRPLAERENRKVDRFSLVVGAQGTNAKKGHLVDLKGKQVYTLEAAERVQGEIDLVHTYGKSTRTTLMLPGSEGLQYFGTRLKEQLYRGWDHKNRGSLIALEGSPGNQKMFKKIKDGQDLEAAYQLALDQVANREGYVLGDHGPNARIQRLSQGDLFLLRIESRDRGILSILGSDRPEVLAIGRIDHIEEGFDGEISIDFKIMAH